MHSRAEDNLRFIRDTMESATAFTGVSGRGFIIAGSTALIATWITEQQDTASAWLGLYGDAVMAAGAYSIRLIPLMGILFIATGAVVLLTIVPATLVFGLSMGCLHIVFGGIIWRYHGG